MRVRADLPEFLVGEVAGRADDESVACGGIEMSALNVWTSPIRYEANTQGDEPGLVSRHDPAVTLRSAVGVGRDRSVRRLHRADRRNHEDARREHRGVWGDRHALWQRLPEAARVHHQRMRTGARRLRRFRWRCVSGHVADLCVSNGQQRRHLHAARREGMLVRDRAKRVRRLRGSIVLRPPSYASSMSEARSVAESVAS